MQQNDSPGIDCMRGCVARGDLCGLRVAFRGELRVVLAGVAVAVPHNQDPGHSHRELLQ